MAQYPAPTYPSNPIFNSLWWETGNTTLTVAEAQQLFLSINGNENVGGNVNFEGGISTNTISPIAAGESLTFGSTGTANFSGSVQVPTGSNFLINGTAVGVPQGAYGQFQYYGNNGVFAGLPSLYYSSGQVSGSITSSTGLNGVGVVVDSGYVCHNNAFTGNPFLLQGAYTGWNYSGGSGETDFFNMAGQGSGGYNFYNQAQNNSASVLNSPTLLASISSAGGLSCSSVSVSSLTVNSPLQIQPQYYLQFLANLNVTSNRYWSSSVRTWNGTCPQGWNYPVNIGSLNGYLVCTTWGASNWAWCSGLVWQGRSSNLTGAGTIPSFSFGNGYLAINNSSGSAAVNFAVWLFTDGVNG